MKSKIKYKLKAAIVAAFSGLTLLVTSLSASAMSGNNEGGSGNTSWTIDDTPFGVLTNNDNFAWRADLYVSTNSDGKIKDSDLIGNQLALVGSVFCTSPTFANYTTYIQTNYTNESRDDFNPNGGRLVEDSEGNLTGVQYTLPTLTEFEPSFPSYTDASNHTVVIADGEDMHLFDGQWKAPTQFSDVQNKLTRDGYETHIKDLLLQLLGKNGQGFFDETFGSIHQQIRDGIVTRANNEKISSVDAFYKYLLPVNPTTGEINTDCMVEWALVLTPLYRFEAVVPFYYRNNGAFSSVSDTLVALDSFWIAEYNAASKLLGSRGWYSQTLNGSPVYNGSGMLSRWLVENSGAPAAAAYCTQSKDPYLGVFNNDGNTSQAQWYSLLQTNPANFAKRGGIAVFTTKITTPEAPVYYHTYTYRINENDKGKLPNGYTTGTYSTDDPQLLKFLDDLTEESVTVAKVEAPKDNIIYPKQIAKDKEMPGIVVAAMAPLPSIAQPGYVDEYPTYTNIKDFYAQLLPDFAGQTKHTQALVDDAKLLKDNGTPDDTAVYNIL